MPLLLPLQQTMDVPHKRSITSSHLQTLFTSNSRQTFHNIFQVDGDKFVLYCGHRSIKKAQPVCGHVQGTHKAAHKIAKVSVGDAQGNVAAFWVVTEQTEFVAGTSKWCPSCTSFALNTDFLLVGFLSKMNGSIIFKSLSEDMTPSVSSISKCLDC